MMTRRFLLPILLLAFYQAVSQAQIMTGSIGGTVADPSGAAVSDVAVTLTQTSTGLVRRSSTDVSGNFLFGGLDGGEYTLAAAKSGFKKTEQKGIMLTTGDRLSIGRLVLELGAVAETVSVTADAAAVQTASSDRSDIITGKQVEDILVQGRNVTDLVALAPGVYQSSTSATLGGSLNFCVQGSRVNANNYRSTAWSQPTSAAATA